MMDGLKSHSEHALFVNMADTLGQINAYHFKLPGKQQKPQAQARTTITTKQKRDTKSKPPAKNIVKHPLFDNGQRLKPQKNYKP